MGKKKKGSLTAGLSVGKIARFRAGLTNSDASLKSFVAYSAPTAPKQKAGRPEGSGLDDQDQPYLECMKKLIDGPEKISRWAAAGIAAEKMDRDGIKTHSLNGTRRRLYRKYPDFVE